MKRLTLVRHASAQWNDPSLADASRPLDRRGLTEAAATARLLAERRLAPDLLLASPAQRTQQTAEILSRELGLDGRRVLREERLYLARPGEILTVIRETGPRIAHLLIVGHNPGLSELTRWLAPEGAEIPDMPTGCCCSMTFATDAWQAVAPHEAYGLSCDAPRRRFPLWA